MKLTRFTEKFAFSIAVLYFLCMAIPVFVSAQREGGVKIVWAEATTPEPGFVEFNRIHEHNLKVYAQSHNTFTLAIRVETNSGDPLEIRPGSVSWHPQGAGIVGFTVDPSDERRATFQTGDSTHCDVNGTFVRAEVIRNGRVQEVWSSMYAYVQNNPYHCY